MLRGPELISVVQTMFQSVDSETPWFGIVLRNVMDFAELVSHRPHRSVYMLRGHCDDRWTATALHMAYNLGLRDTEITPWHDTYRGAPWPPTMLQRLKKPLQLHIITSSEESTAEVEVIEAQGGLIAAEQEARLLGYPLCCVQAYHRRHHQFIQHVGELYRRAANDDPQTMRQLIETDKVIPIDHIVATCHLNGYLSPVCSFAYCDACAVNVESPGQRENRRRKRFFQHLEPALISSLKRWNDARPSRRQMVHDCVAEGLRWSTVDSVLHRFDVTKAEGWRFRC